MILIMIVSFLLNWLNQVTDGLQQCEIGKIIEVEKRLSMKVTSYFHVISKNRYFSFSILTNSDLVMISSRKGICVLN